MSIKFDITDVLPTADAINGERSRLEGRLRRVTRLGWAVIGLLVLLDAVLWWEWSQGSWANDWLLLAAVAAVSVSVCTIIYVCD